MKNYESGLSYPESIKLIEEMILSAKKDMQDNRFYFLLWGWLALGASLSEYVLLKVLNYPYHYVVWALMGFIGGIASAVHSRRAQSRQRVKTYIDDFIRSIWICCGCCLVVLFFLFSRIGFSNTAVLVIMLYGVGTFLTGAALQFKPLIIGGICCWVIGVITILSDPEVSLLLLSLSVVVSYLIPGYMMLRKRDV
jgi:hypothetical protein